MDEEMENLRIMFRDAWTKQETDKQTGAMSAVMQMQKPSQNLSWYEATIFL